MIADFVVFVGPSLAAEAAAELFPVSYRSPAAQGDILKAVRDGARAIGLIDGYFEGVPAVWHKEILFALSSGVHVFGAASMGALRAAELAPFGMCGVGQIFAWYRDGVIDADDEVALIHGPAETSFVSLSEPLVNVRATLIEAASSARSIPSAWVIFSMLRAHVVQGEDLTENTRGGGSFPGRERGVLRLARRESCRLEATGRGRDDRGRCRPR